MLLFLCPGAPDILHKDNVSGGAPYSITLPNAGAVGQSHRLREWHGDGTYDACRATLCCATMAQCWIHPLLQPRGLYLW